MLLCVFTLNAVGQESFDTLAYLRRTTTPWYKTNVMKGVYVTAPLVGASFMVRSVDSDFRSMCVNMKQTKNWQWEDYVQYSPLAACYIMKVAGMKSRSAWGRMLVSHAFAAGTMATFVNGMKYAIKERRPDETARNSFPSGHTATAFMAATLLHREYGHVSPWISIGAYTVATATGVGRVVHNRHWASDVLCGAGIGVMTGELGYFFADLIFKDKYKNNFPVRENFDRFHNPSYLSLRVGVSVPLTSYSFAGIDSYLGLPSEENVHFLTGSDAAIDGAYFFNPYIGIGGTFHIVSSNLAVEKKFTGTNLETKNLEALIANKQFNTNCNLTAYNALVTIHGSYPFSKLLRLDAKLGGGYSYSTIHQDPYRNSFLFNAVQDYQFGKTGRKDADEFVQALKEELPQRSGEMDIADVRPSNSFALTSGVSFHVTPSRLIDASVYADWNMMTGNPLSAANKSFHMINTGLSCAMRF